MKNKRGQGLSLNTIIIAAIALIVLVVLVMIFTGRMGGFTRGLGKATTCDQACKAGGYNTAKKGGDGVTTDGADGPGITTANKFQYCDSSDGFKKLVGYKWGEGTATEQGYACCCKNTP